MVANQNLELPPVIFLMGPTASGKTETASRIFERFKCELVSVDAAQVYRGMDIGTAKPDHEFLQAYPHHLIDIIGIEEQYSAARFCEDASRLVQEIMQRGKTPVFVGGTMFYFSALENGLSSLPSADPKVRSKLADELRKNGLAALYQQLVDVDPDFAERISSNDSQRIQRALELFRQTNTPPSRLMPSASASLESPENFGAMANPIVKIALFAGNRKFLHQQIERRFIEMLDRGLLHEVAELVRGIEDPQDLNSMRTVGYRQVLDFLTGKLKYQQMMDSGIAATRQLAKRQFTWMRNQSNLVWFDNYHPGTAEALSAYLEAQNFCKRQG